MGITESKLSVSHESYVKEERSSSSRNPDVRTIPQCLEYYARTVPDKEAAVFISTDAGREAITFKEVYEKSKAVAYNLLSLGVKRHEIVAVNLRTCPEWLYVTFGAMMVGITPFPISFNYKDGSDVVEVFERVSNCSCIVMGRGYDGENWNIFSKLLDSYSSDGKAASKVIPSLRYLIGYKDSITGAKSFDEMMRDDGSNLDCPGIKEEDTAILLQTSGTTGVPKAIAHTHASLITFTDIELGPAYCKDGPTFNERSFNWVGGFPFSLLIGQTRITCSGMCPPPKDRIIFLMDIIRQERCHSFITLPVLMQEMLKRKDDLGEDWPLKTIIVGGQPITKHSISFVGTICKYIVVSYASSEVLFVSRNVLSDTTKFIEHNCGQVFTNREIKVVDSDGNTVPVGESGEIYIRGNNVFKGYYNDPVRNRAAFTEDGWYKTDDVGRILKDGSMIAEGRLSNKINVGGFKVSPEIMENVLKSCPGVESAVIVPVPDEVRYQVVCACVKAVPGSSINETVLRKFCEDIHGDKERAFTVLPTYYLFLESYPETSTGKVSRKALEAVAKGKFSK